MKEARLSFFYFPRFDLISVLEAGTAVAVASLWGSLSHTVDTKTARRRKKKKKKKALPRKINFQS